MGHLQRFLLADAFYRVYNLFFVHFKTIHRPRNLIFLLTLHHPGCLNNKKETKYKLWEILNFDMEQGVHLC